jgi:hypothetical protein
LASGFLSDQSHLTLETANQFITDLIIPAIIAFVAAFFYIWLTDKDKFKPVDTNLAKLFSVQLLLEKICFSSEIGAFANIASAAMAKRFNQSISLPAFMTSSAVITVLTIDICIPISISQIRMPESC